MYWKHLKSQWPQIHNGDADISYSDGWELRRDCVGMNMREGGRMCTYDIREACIICF